MKNSPVEISRKERPRRAAGLPAGGGMGGAGGGGGMGSVLVRPVLGEIDAG